MGREGILGVISAIFGVAGSAVVTALFAMHPTWATWILYVSLAVCTACLLGGLWLIFAGRRQARVKGDKSVSEGVAFIHFREWGRSVSQDGGGIMDAMNAALDELHDAAVNGRVSVWGREKAYGPCPKIKAEFWGFEEIDMTRLMYPGASSRTTPDHNGRNPTYQDLMVSRAEFEREWPPMSLSRRAAAALSALST